MGCVLLLITLLVGCAQPQPIGDTGCHTDDCRIHVQFPPPDPQQVEKDVDAIRAGMQIQHGSGLAVVP